MADTNEIDLKARFIEVLTATNRKGVDAVIAGLEQLGFFDAPASSKHHLAEKGGLLKHSFNVYLQAMAIRETQIGLKPLMEERLPKDSVAIAALLHDVCKAEIYRPEVKRRKNAEGKWEDYLGYNIDYSPMPLGHGEKSVIRLLRMGLDLTNDEILAIRWHMSAWDMADTFEAKGCFSAATEKCPLLSVIVAADQLATWITENK